MGADLNSPYISRGMGARIHRDEYTVQIRERNLKSVVCQSYGTHYKIINKERRTVKDAESSR